jgi:hypothetical protein
MPHRFFVDLDHENELALPALERGLDRAVCRFDGLVRAVVRDDDEISDQIARALARKDALTDLLAEIGNFSALGLRFALFGV